MANIDKDRLLAAMRNGTQNPVAAAQVIARLEAGEFDVAAVDSSAPAAAKKRKADVVPAETAPQTSPAPDPEGASEKA